MARRYALAVRAPWNKSFAELARFTDEQWAEIIFRATDRDVSKKTGAYWPAEDERDSRRGRWQKTSIGGFKGNYWRIKRLQGCPEDRIPELWENYLRKNPALRPRQRRNR